MTARVKRLRVEERTLSLTGEIADCYIFDWYLRDPKNWATDNEREIGRAHV